MSTRATGPLSGLRVLDLGLSWAGPFAGMILADLGADVIKVESGVKLDILRWSGAFADGVRDPERSGFYGACNRGKRSVTLNFKHDRAKELLLDLVETADILIENFAPRVLPSLGLGYEQLRQRNPQLIMVSMSGYGSTGPEGGFVSYGDHLMQASGMASQTGAEGDPPTMIGTFYGDPVGGMYAVSGLLAALTARDQGAGGTWLDLSQLEGLVALQPEALLRSDLGERLIRSASGSREQAPQGYFRCKGPDSWVALAVRNDAEWSALREILAESGVETPVAATLDERREQDPDIVAALAGWTRERSPWQVAEALQSRGIPAYPMIDAPNLMRSQHLAERSFFEWVHHPITGPAPLPGVTLRISGGRSAVRGYAPLLGEHNEEVFVGEIGIDPSEFQQLVAEGAIA